MAASTLYICYFGVREPLVQTQVLPYLREIRKGGTEVSLLTFEPPAGENWETQMQAALEAEGIDWHWLRYHKRLSVIATAYDVFQGVRMIRRLMLRERFDILHARVHIPMLMASIARKLSPVKPELLFDIRGFFPEEYTDAGLWKENGLLYRTVKRVERWLMKEADGFVVLTEAAREILFPESAAGGVDKLGRPVEVIPCCVDLHRFEKANGESRTEVREKLGADGRFVIAYVGSFGGWYPTRETAEFFGAVKNKREDAFALILTQGRREMIEPLLREASYSAGDYWIGRVPSEEIPSYVSAADAAVSFIKPCYSKQASSPTKNAEYLACGLPIIANDGVGDTTEQITEDETGVIIRNFDTASYNNALDELDELLADREALASRCRASAERRFDLERVGGERYRRLYRRLLGGRH